MAPLTIKLRSDEACRPQPQLLWDTVWVQAPVTSLTAEGGFGEWMPTNGDAPNNQGGLRATATLHTATLLCLFTDRRAPDDADLEDGDDPRGWWGDSLKFEADEFERELGSHLWMLERGTLSEQTAIIAQEMAEQALAVLVEQGAVARTDVEAEVDPPNGWLKIAVRHFSQDGSKIYDQKFQVLWAQWARWPQAQTLTPY